MAMLERELDNAKAAAAVEKAQCEAEGTKVPGSLTERGEAVTVSRNVPGLVCFTGHQAGTLVASDDTDDDNGPDGCDVGGGH